MAPTLQMNKFAKTCPNSAAIHPVRQGILDLLDQKVQATDHKAALNEIIQAHNKARNPIGAPFKGETKRPAPKPDDGNDAKDAKTYASEPDGPKSRDEFQEEHIIAGQSSDHEFVIKGQQVVGPCPRGLCRLCLQART